MVKRLARSRNTNSAPTNTSVTLNTSTYTELVAEEAQRSNLEIFNNSNHGVLLWFGPIGTASDADAIPLVKKSEYYSLADNPDTCQISGKALAGIPTIMIKES